jgi:phosphoglycerol transferase MdoB-like AlkP superfamily enzyme
MMASVEGRGDTRTPDLGRPGLVGHRPQALETALFLVVLASLAAKLIVLSVTLDDEPFPVERHVGSATLAAVLLLAAPLALLPRGRSLAALLLNAILTSLALADAVHFRFFGDVISIPGLTRAPQLRGVVSSVVEAIRTRDALLYLDLLPLTAAVVLLRLRTRPPVHPVRLRAALAAGLVLAGFLAARPTLRMVRDDPEEVFEYANARRQIVAAIGLLPYHVFDASVYAAYPLRGRLGTTEGERRRVRSFYEARWREPRPRSPLFGIARNRNVIFVMAESLHDFPLGLDVGGRAVTPHIDAFAKESIRFVDFFDQTFLGATSDGEFTSLQSLHPLPSGAVSTRFAANDFHGLPAILDEHGYGTFSSIGQPGDYWNMRQMHLALGFQLSRFFPTNLRDEEFFARTVPALDSLPEPFFAFLITLTNHHPFKTVAAEERVLDLGDVEGTLVGDYVHSVHAFDHAFGELLEALRARGLLDDTMVVLYGDHQAWLGDAPELARLLGFPAASELDYWLLKKKVPLLIRLPGGTASAERRAAGGHLDIAPTVMALLGITEPASPMLGRDLTADEPGLVVFRDGSFTDGSRHYLQRFGPDDASHAYDAETHHRIDSALLRPEARQAADQLLASDLVLEGNLVPWVREVATARPGNP